MTLLHNGGRMKGKLAPFNQFIFTISKSMDNRSSKKRSACFYEIQRSQAEAERTSGKRMNLLPCSDHGSSKKNNNTNCCYKCTMYWQVWLLIFQPREWLCPFFK